MEFLEKIFENQPDSISPDEAAQLTGYKRKTFYDMKYDPQKFNVPEGMFFKVGRKLRLRTDKFKEWFLSRSQIEGKDNELSN